jgi:lipoprotein-releasing system ATP-binding protein
VAPPDPPLLELRDVTRQLPEGAVLVRDVNLLFRRGEFVAVTGPSGSGKSSLLYLLGLLDRPSAGHVLLEGRDTREADDE